jgi:type III pantothenate kinase
MLRALHQGAELLPEIALGDSPPAAIGRNTADAMRSGAWWGSVGVIESLVTRIKAEQTGSIDVIITGGHAEWLAREMKETPEIVPALTLEGLAILVARTAT